MLGTELLLTKFILTLSPEEVIKANEFVLDNEDVIIRLKKLPCGKPLPEIGLGEGSKVVDLIAMRHHIERCEQCSGLKILLGIMSIFASEYN